jgi:hypothetical protein
MSLQCVCRECAALTPRAEQRHRTPQSPRPWVQSGSNSGAQVPQPESACQGRAAGGPWANWVLSTTANASRHLSLPFVSHQSLRVAKRAHDQGLRPSPGVRQAPCRSIWGAQGQPRGPLELGCQQSCHGGPRRQCTALPHTIYCWHSRHTSRTAHKTTSAAKRAHGHIIISHAKLTCVCPSAG